jgi:hypothetical protein
MPRMEISMHTMAVDTFKGMLESLGQWLERGRAHAEAKRLDIVNARLAPDMYPLSQQVQQACFHARDAVGRLTGRGPAQTDETEKTIPGLKQQIARTLELLRSVEPSAFAGAAARDCSIKTPTGLLIEMDGVRYLQAYALPHFYFHIVTAYDILRHDGVDLGKKDYLSQVGAFIKKP